MKSARLSPTAQLLAAIATAAAITSSASAQFALTGSSYLETFDTIGTSLPANWDVRTGANSSSLGTTASFTTAVADWGATGGAFKNLASATGLNSTDLIATQSASSDRALGIRQTGAFGDAGAAFNFNFNASGKTFSQLSIDLEMLSVQTRSTTWSIQYGIGSSPSTFTTLGTYSDPGAFGTTTLSFNAGDLVGMNNQANVWFRVVALTASSGSGSRDSFGIDNFSLTFAASGAEISIGAGATFSAFDFGGAAFTAGDIAVFNGVAGTVNLGGAVAASGLKFTTSGYTLASPSASDTITVTGAVEVADGATATLAGKVTGSNSLNKTGTGTLILTNTDNDFVGAVSVGGGTLEVSSDAALGNAANDVNLGGGTFRSSGSLSLGAGRDLTGSGSVAVGSGSTLTINGTVNASALTVADTGILALNGSSNTVGTLGFSAAGTVTGNAIAVNGLTSSAYSGTAVVENALSLGGSTRTFNTTGDVTLNGAITTSATGAYLVKNGSGTLTINGDTSGHQGGIQLGTQGATPVEGGRLVIGASAGLGSNQVRFNSGTLEFAGTTPRTFATTLSIGGRAGSSVSIPTISGADVTFTGTGSSGTTANGFFKNNGLTTAMAFNVNNTTTVTGDWFGNTGTAAGVILGGSGKFVIEGNAGAITETWTLADTVTFQLKNALGGGVNVASGTTLMGTGTVSGLVSVSSGGTLSAGNAGVAGTFTANGGLTLERGATMSFDLGGGSVTDTISTTAFTLSGGTGEVVLDFNGTGAAGVYQLMSFTSLAGDFVVGDISFFDLTDLAPGLTGSLELAADKLVLTVIGSTIPEPASVAGLAGLGAVGAVGLRRRRRA